MTNLPEPRRFTNQAASAAVYDHGAHVVEWTPADQAPVLWMSAKSMFDSASPIRGGVPVCLPWFGAGRSGGMAPAHGTARISYWHLLDTVESATVTSVTYGLDHEPSAQFPHNFHAELLIEFGSELSLELSVTNFGTSPMEFEEALHTYLSVGDVEQARIVGLDGAAYQDKAPGGAAGPVVQQGDVTFTGETDRIYATTGDVALIDPVLGRRIIVTRTHSANAVVWNPWVAKAAAMPDFGDGEWTGMVCIEGANVADDAITLAPGATHTMGYRLRVEALA